MYTNLDEIHNEIQRVHQWIMSYKGLGNNVIRLTIDNKETLIYFEGIGYMVRHIKSNEYELRD